MLIDTNRPGLRPIHAAVLQVEDLDRFALLRGIFFAGLASIALWAVIFEAWRLMADALA